MKLSAKGREVVLRATFAASTGTEYLICLCRKRTKSAVKWEVLIRPAKTSTTYTLNIPLTTWANLLEGQGRDVVSEFMLRPGFKSHD